MQGLKKPFYKRDKEFEIPDTIEGLKKLHNPFVDIMIVTCIFQKVSLFATLLTIGAIFFSWILDKPLTLGGNVINCWEILIATAGTTFVFMMINALLAVLALKDK